MPSTVLRVAAWWLAFACVVWSSSAAETTTTESVTTSASPGDVSPPGGAPHRPLTNVSALIASNQFRSDCRTRRFLLVDPSVFNVREHPRSHAPGAKVHKEDTLDLAKVHLRLAGALAEAIHSNRTLLFSESSRVIREPARRQSRAPGATKAQGQSGEEAAGGPEGLSADLTTQQMVKIFMRKCSLFHHTSHRPFYTADEPGVARLRYHHSCWFQPISNCAVETDVTEADWQALEGRPDAHENRLKFSGLAQAQAAMWVPPIALRPEEEQAHVETHMGMVEHWSSSLTAFLLRPVALMEKHLAAYVHRVSGEFLQFVPGATHFHLTGASMRLPPAKATGPVQTMTVTQHWRQYLKILEQLIQRQSQLLPEERLLETHHIWVSTWEARQFDLIESWHDKAKANNTWLADKHVILSQLRDADKQHHEEDAFQMPPGLEDEADIDAPTFGATDHDQRAILDRLNLQALHGLEDVAILGRTSYFIASVSHAHAVWLQLIRYGHLYATPPIWLHAPFSSQAFFPAHTGFERDEGVERGEGGKWMTNAERWMHAVQVLRPQNAADLRRPRLSPDTALPEIPFEAIDDLLPLWNVPVMPFRRATPSQRIHSATARGQPQADTEAEKHIMHDEL